MSNYEVFNARGRLLLQEGYLIHSCLFTGCGDLLHANLSDRGKFYSAFFLLSIGLERLMKVALIVEHMARNQLSAPEGKLIRSRGHELSTLFEDCSSFAFEYEVEDFRALDNELVNREILLFLSDFAKSRRYFNLNRLADPAGADNDPLSGWHRILEAIVENDISRADVESVNRDSEELGRLFSSNKVFIFTDIGGNAPSADDLFAEDAVMRLAAPYALARVFSIIASLYELMYVLVRKVHTVDRDHRNELLSVPFLEEFIEFARYPDPEIWGTTFAEDS